MGVIVAKLYDLATTELADISNVALEKTMTSVHNGARQFVIQAMANESVFTDVAGDGFPNLEAGDRKLLVWEDGTIIFHGRIFNVERNGDGTSNRVTITAFDPFMELGFDPDKAGRPVRGSTVQPTAGTPFGNYDGNFISPLFASSVGAQVGVSGPDLIYQILTNSQNTGVETDPTPGEGPLPIDLTTGTFDLTVPPAVDLSALEVVTWPKMCGDFITMLTSTGTCDFFMRPVDPTEGLDSYAMVALSAVSRWGTDKSASVNFDYFTGDYNAGAVRYSQDFSTVCNKLYDLLGPAINASSTRWKADLTPTLAGVSLAAAITASRTRYGGPAMVPGQFMQIREYDIAGTGSGSMVLNLALWTAEQTYRVNPRDLLYITPRSDTAGVFTAPQDFDTGDTIAINVGADFGLALADTQVVFGYVKTWSREGVASLSELVTSADVTI